MSAGLDTSTVTPGRTPAVASRATPAIALCAPAIPGTSTHPRATNTFRSRRVISPPSLIDPPRAISLRSKRDRKVVTSLRIARVQFESTPVVLDGFTDPALRVQGDAETVVSERVVGFEREGLPQRCDGLVTTPLPKERVAEVVVCRGGIRSCSNRVGEVLHRAIEMTSLRVQQRYIVVQRRVVGIRLEALLDADDLLAHDSLARGAGQPRAVRRVACHHLQPELGHLVGRVLPVRHATWRAMGVVRVRGGVVIGEFERDDRASREELWTRVPKDALPVEIPLADVDQPLSGSIGQRRVTLDLLGEEMRVRLNG